MLELVVDKGRDCQGLIPTLVSIEDEEEAMDFRTSSESQLQEVSRGANKLTQMINSLSRAPNLDGRSKYIADDLMRSALDLQESLEMLGRLQEASKMMAQRKRRPKLDLMEERKKEEVEFDIQSMGSRRFDVSVCHTRLQGPRLSVDGASRNHGDELKNVIRSSLHRENLLSNSLDDGRACSSRSLNFSSSCRFGDLNFERKKPVGSISANVQPLKVKAPNLIAKLMGLEEVPSQTVEPIQKEQEKMWANFDMEMPKPTKLQAIDQNLERKQKSLQEIIGSMQSKGLLKRGQVEDQKILSGVSSTSHSDRYGANVLKDDESPPIVIMKPMHLPCWERGDAPKDLLLGKASRQEENQSVKLVQEKKVCDREGMPHKTSGKKEVKRIEKTKPESLEKSNTRSTEFHKHRRKESIRTVKKSEEGQKPLLKGKKLEANKDVKDIRASTKPEKRTSLAKNSIQQERHVNLPGKPASRSSNGSSKEKKTSGAELLKSSMPAEQVKNLEVDGKASNPVHTMGVTSTTSTFPADSKDGISKDPRIFCEVMPKTIHVGKRFESAEGTTLQLPCKIPIITRSTGIGDDLKRLLMSSNSFLRLANEFFGLDAHQPIYYRRKNVDEIVTRNAKLFLDCGKELLVRRSHQREFLSHLVFQAHLWDRTVYTSLDRMVEEISNEIEKQISYTAAVDCNDKNSEGTQFLRLERDLKCKEMMMNSMWDIGWRNWICVESEQNMSEVEEHIMSLLIDEIVTGFVY